jgi:predicted MFS family arabinose efflux permease
MALFSDDIRTVLWFAVPPAVIAVVILVLGVSEPKPAHKHDQVPLKLEEIALLGRLYWLVVGAGAVFTLARFSEAFLVLRAQSGGLAVGLAPAVIAVMSLVFAVSAYPAGRIQDKVGARPLLLAGLAALIVADLLLGFGQSLVAIFAGIGLWGLHLGLTQGVLAALVAATAPKRLRGTAFGLFGLVTGLFTLLASVLAGMLWVRIGADATFTAGAGFAALALLAFAFMREPSEDRG